MKPIAWGLVFLVVGCSPSGPCRPETCVGGCCNERGQCVPGNSSEVCGAAGSMCVACLGNDRCLAGACVAGVDAGIVELDAGPTRTVELRQTDEFFLADASVRLDEVDLNAQPEQPLLVEAADGGWLQLSRTRGTGPVLRYERVPVGPWLFARGEVWVASDSDTFDMGARVIGRRDRSALAPSTLLSIVARGVVPGVQMGDGTAIGVTSVASGTTTDAARVMVTQLGAQELTASIDLASAPQPFGLSAVAGDDLTVVLRRTVIADGGARWGAATMSASVAAPDVSSGTTGVATVDFVPLALEPTRVRVQTSSFEPFVSVAHPSAMIGNPAGALFAYAPAPRGGGVGDFEGRSTQLAAVAVVNRGQNIDLTMTHGRPFGSWPLQTESRLPVTVPLMVGGRVFSRSFDAIHVTRTDSDVVVLEVSPPTALRLNGSPAQAPLAGVGTSPVLEWSAPAVGVPSAYVVTISRLSGGVTITETLVARLRTPFTRVRIPPGVLLPGEPHFAIVTAVKSTGVDSKRWGLRTSRAGGRGSALTDIFVP